MVNNDIVSTQALITQTKNKKHSCVIAAMWQFSALLTFVIRMSDVSGDVGGSQVMLKQQQQKKKRLKGKLSWFYIPKTGLRSTTAYMKKNNEAFCGSSCEIWQIASSDVTGVSNFRTEDFHVWTLWKVWGCGAARVTGLILSVCSIICVIGPIQCRTTNFRRTSS